MEATHIIKPDFCKTVSVNDILEGCETVSLWSVSSNVDKDGVYSGKSFDTKDEAVASWNSQFSKARGAYDYE